MDRILMMFPDLGRGARSLGSSWGQANADGKEGLINPDSVTVLGPVGAPRVCWHSLCELSRCQLGPLWLNWADAICLGSPGAHLGDN